MSIIVIPRDQFSAQLQNNRFTLHLRQQFTILVTIMHFGSKCGSHYGTDDKDLKELTNSLE